MKSPTINHADLVWNEQGTPVSQFFDDVYFSNDNGLEETRYVFLEGNDLSTRLLNSQQDTFTLAETGFGTGLNFLTLWQSYQLLGRQNSASKLPRLHFISCEKYPLTLADLELAHGHWPELASFSQALRQQWPDALPGCHRLILAQGQITLDLWFGDINDMLEDLNANLVQKVDAWFLDGFAPSKNPDMWTDELFSTLAITAKQTGTFATFTAAGFVRRGLEQAGFNVIRRKGFAHKREMLIGQLAIPPNYQHPMPWYPRPSANNKEIAIVGGGIASACLCIALVRRGWQVTHYCADAKPAGNASGNRQGAVYPLLHAQDPQLATFFSAAFTFAKRFYQALPFSFEHQWCGVLQLGWDEKSRKKIDQLVALSLPPSFARFVSAEEASKLAGLAVEHSGIFYPEGGWLSPAELTTKMFDWAISQGVECHWECNVENLKRQSQGDWQLDLPQGGHAKHHQVVLANGHQLNQFTQTEAIPVYPVAGQVSHVEKQQPLSQLATVLCYEGYLTPLSDTYQSHCIGASYRRGKDDCDYSPEEQLTNQQRLTQCLPDSDWAASFNIGDQARIAVRCAIRDHLPMAGILSDYQQFVAEPARVKEAMEGSYHPGLYLLGGFGSRGLSSAPLAAELLASQLSGEALPLDQSTLNALHPGRFWIRKRIKGRPIA
ncbi:bifunctional tRNA (5-methylaminomethyl-2-thiouridine)(34)-methyltransferase MnmD/FAD-dependent 5-carboxymethylaminomethyl-2-thiouridine(34) oxidoreductase MnmC [Tatumella ptyseos]|uniref:bifunctional tRNA (5-methylaminomethyl-2-thiouridine)(34)-methyltransferase MnmD/FAD-dependent 5-carboxymethylaminomethyl-2-thiouridine(34) oxidoreductase MnmC n=1 Tax=Tatumella ptyseos TaxID=82987 RepID=UPI0026F194AC|nr:bifunctional tRNA (5-methylaminomethyl-2-thiouridine)(34)-methyltransferase MnmD/FAD-dependent 5-carboxymethylaminomethyl-2-thiouridine(34) oxidoreductase MnmC [Tatumella ptyseos]WKX25558.1 bifunctional tRNA (5-methylaminomethyl-2-thiouridine)(34)-methyltransferase MnmD/FAD-dependent 5-carboxymethylaminomethyl-2-thiouridine(34) oxidoreductase MnmC [Tatumella ptyseos]